MYLPLLLLLCITVVAIADYTKWNISSISSRKLERFIDQASNFFPYIRGKKARNDNLSAGEALAKYNDRIQ